MQALLRNIIVGQVPQRFLFPTLFFQCYAVFSLILRIFASDTKDREA